jgi:hypothetical protein
MAWLVRPKHFLELGLTKWQIGYINVCGRNATNHPTNIANLTKLSPKYQVGFDVPPRISDLTGRLVPEEA